MMESSKIPPIQLPITAIATNITQTPQTPLDQKVALTKPEKPVIAKVKKRKKDQVTITDQHWTMLKERREIEKLRDLQIVLLFSQLMKQGLSQLQWSVDQIAQRLVTEEMKKSEVRQALPFFHQEILTLLNKRMTPIEKQLGFLIEKGPNLIEAHQGYWQIKNRQRTYPVQIMLATMEAELGTIRFPNTLEKEAVLEETRRAVEKKVLCVKSLKRRVKETEKIIENQKEKMEKTEKQRAEKQAIFYSWEKLAKKKEVEQANIQKKIQQMELVHPLKRKQQEYQAHLLRNQIVQKERITITIETKKAASNNQMIETEAIQLQEALLVNQEKRTSLQKEVIQLKETYQEAVDKEAELLRVFQMEFSQAYQELKEVFNQYLMAIYEEQAKILLLEKDYREQLTEVLKELKQILKEESPRKTASIMRYIKQELMSRQTETLLSQANADPINVQYLLDEKS